MTLPEHAAQLTTEWAGKHGTWAGNRESSLVEHVLTRLGDPDNDYSVLLDELCRSRWTAIAEEVA